MFIKQSTKHQKYKPQLHRPKTKSVDRRSKNTHHTTDADVDRRSHSKRENYYRKQLSGAQIITVPTFNLDNAVQSRSSNHYVHRPTGWEETIAPTLRLMSGRRVLRVQDNTGKDILIYFPNAIKEKPYASAYDAGAELVENYKFKHKPSIRHKQPSPVDSPHGVIHTMFWHAIGHRNGQLYYSRDGIAHGNCTGFKFLARFLVALIGVIMQLSPLLKALDPEQYDRQIKAVNNAPAECTLLKLYKYMPWLGVIFGANLITDAHHDNADDQEGWAGSVCFGDFSGAEFCVPELGIRLPFQPKDLILFKSFALEHFTTKWTGRCRYFTVFSTHKSTLEEIEGDIQ